MRANSLVRKIKNILKVDDESTIYVDYLYPNESCLEYVRFTFHNFLTTDGDGDFYIKPFSWWITDDSKIVQFASGSFVIAQIDGRRFKFYKSNSRKHP